MAAHATRSKHRARELRRPVVVRARVKSGAQWSDAHILNVSTRGLQIRIARPVPVGTLVHILRGSHLIVARVMWSAAGRCGLRSEERVPVEDIVLAEQLPSVQLIASNGVLQDRRKGSRATPSDARQQGRAMEFVAVGAIGALLAVGAWAFASHALAAPLERVAAALAG